MTNILSMIDKFKEFNSSLTDFIKSTPLEEFVEYNQKTIQDTINIANPQSDSSNYYEATEDNLLRQTRDLHGTYITPVFFLNRSNETKISMDRIFLFNMGKITTFKK